MDLYTQYLDEHNIKQTIRQLLYHPVRELSKNVHICYIESVAESHSIYSLLQSTLPSENYQPIFIEEEKPALFTNRMERYRFVENLKLSVPLQMIRYDPGGAAINVNVLWKAPEEFDPNEMMTQGAQILKEVSLSF